MVFLLKIKRRRGWKIDLILKVLFKIKFIDLSFMNNI
jgi:hypothetical protein